MGYKNDNFSIWMSVLFKFDWQINERLFKELEN